MTTRGIARVAVPILLAIGILAWAMASAQSPVRAPEQASRTLDIARFTPDGKLLKPADLDHWVFLGTSLGMGYNPGSFNAARPGQFQVVLMEPAAYQHFVRTPQLRTGLDAAAFVLRHRTAASFDQQNGFTQAELTNFEIHLLDPAKGDQGHAFYTFDADGTRGNLCRRAMAACSCHNEHGAFQGTFAQFYPTIRPLIPKEALERLCANHDIR